MSPGHPLSHLHPVLQRVYYARQVDGADELDLSLDRLPAPDLLSGMDTMGNILADAVMGGRRLLVLADFDADGATACAVAMKGLRALGAESVDYLVPNRFEYGYGLTPEIVALAAQRKPDYIVTVDNGISSLEGVAAAKERGIGVLVTDHHLPGGELPAADAIVNPNLPGDMFPSKSLAGVGVMFYVLAALRTRLRQAGWFARHGISEPNLGRLLDLVALGTVADVVPLDRVNRVLVHQGLARIRAGQAQPGVLAMLEAAGRKHGNATAADLGFSVAPRLNAAGRLEDMSFGIECLLCDDYSRALPMTQRLDELNGERRAIEAQMQAEALELLKRRDWSLGSGGQPVVCLYDDGWHQGVIGILASRIKDRLHRPVIAFAPGGEGELKGSARSIAGVHIRDLLSEVAAAYPGLLQRFGGHAMAAGLGLRSSDYAVFVAALNDIAVRHASQWTTEQVVYSDGALGHEDFRLQFAEELRDAGPWGQGFPEPVFDGVFDVTQARILGGQHLRLGLALPDSGRRVDAMAFRRDDAERWLGCERLRLAYRLDVNDYRDTRSLQLVVDYLEPA